MYIDQPFLEQNADTVVLLVGSCRRSVQFSYYLVAKRREVVVALVTSETVDNPFRFDFHEMAYPLLHLAYSDSIKDLLLKTLSSGKLKTSC